MILTKLYNTDIDCNKYNLRIDESISVTVTLTDFDEYPITNTLINISCSSGTLSSNSGITNSNGVVQVTYTPTKWGIHTITCNNRSVQVNVRGGWKDLSATKNHSSVSSFSAKYNQDMVKLTVNGTFPSGTSPVTLITLNDVNFAPYTNTVSPSHVQYGQITVLPDGTVRSLINTQNTNYWGCYYPRRIFYE